MKKNAVIILAGGSGSRINKDLPKQYMEIKGKTILHYTIERFENHPRIHEIIIVTNGHFLSATEGIVNSGGFQKVTGILEGGAKRQDSSRIGVDAVNREAIENVLIHDAARPFVADEIIDNMLDKLEDYSAVNVAVPSADTIIQVGKDNCIEAVPNRTQLRRVQTPQGFNLALIRKAHQMALARNMTDATDDCSLILTFKLAQVYVIEGRPENIKITYPMDLKLAEMILQQ
jgi:2-C-methyl-D-erythritol 4-phosphate cytidylyltransferase